MIITKTESEHHLFSRIDGTNDGSTKSMVKYLNQNFVIKIHISPDSLFLMKIPTSLSLVVIWNSVLLGAPIFVIKCNRNE